ncbi:adenosylcobinamide-GDP ribazoletransferase [Marinomonas posidonica]|uniref:Adenosylcobinamide-GDP ribazoletransferase n=1 Tax=Marinomonas posidonica (strain CECT 7376 / NCIMB 14433 / IVIA-Po-181) TaxID=491952 RepID=F6CWA1_MARPP|nr:adenosylcobinamide-GDP ribazoletransferase [Marinomonas posidonica]AEF55462.1 Cobalamin synthase [Marinomonas posidonica IVIA-Po-181]
MKNLLTGAYWQGFKRSLATYTRIPLRVDWRDDVEHLPAVSFLPWVGIVVAIVSTWPLWFDWSTSLQALFMLLTAVLLTGGFHEDGLMDTSDGLVGGWNKEQRLTIMKDSRLGSYAALSIWFSLTLKWLLLSELLNTGSNSFLGLIYLITSWCAVHVLARVFPLVLMHCLDYVTLGDSKAQSMIARFGMKEWIVALVPCAILAILSLSLLEIALVAVLAALFLLAIRQYLQHKIQGFNGDALGASEQFGEIFVIAALLVFAS